MIHSYDVNAHLHCGGPLPDGACEATIKAEYAMTTHNTVRAKVHRPIDGITYNLNGKTRLGVRFRCGGASANVRLLAHPGGIDLCVRCDEVFTATSDWSVYCYYNRSGYPLYVGQTKSFRSRDKSHRASSAWYSDVAWSAIVGTYDSLDVALLAERRAIRELRPLHNVRHNVRRPA